MNPQLSSPPHFDPAIPVRSSARILVIGCGNLLRGDDAAGPVLVRRLWQRGLPPDVHCADGGTGGMDVAFQMRGVEHVILVDACTTGPRDSCQASDGNGPGCEEENCDEDNSHAGSPAGTLYEVPGDELETLPPLTGLNLHAFRWDHALAFARWLLKEDYPEHITVYLIEAASTAHGAELTPAVSQAIDRLADILFQKFAVPPTVSITQDGYLRMDRWLAARHFPEDSLVALVRPSQLWLLPTRGAAAGGFILKQRTRGGERAVLLSEVFQFTSIPAGRWPACWDSSAGGLRVDLGGPSMAAWDASRLTRQSPGLEVAPSSDGQEAWR